VPGRLAPEDLQYFDLKDLRASPGPIIQTPRGPQRVPAIVPAVKPDGSCIFFNDGLCDVHEHAPFACACLDVHMADVSAELRSRMSIVANSESEEYLRVWERLEPIESDPADRVNRFQVELRKAQRHKLKKGKR
jgi:hypothetical protein